MVLQKVVGLYEKPYKTQTIGQKRIVYGLKWSQENTLDDKKFPHTFFLKMGCRVFKF